MRLFLYGTLLDAFMLARLAGQPRLRAQTGAAALFGWKRVALAASRFPTLRRAPQDVVAGTVVEANAEAMRRLTAYEGARYRLTRVVVTTAGGKTAAFTWIAPGPTRRPWRSSHDVAATPRPARRARRRNRHARARARS